MPSMTPVEGSNTRPAGSGALFPSNWYLGRGREHTHEHKGRTSPNNPCTRKCTHARAYQSIPGQYAPTAASIRAQHRKRQQRHTVARKLARAAIHAQSSPARRARAPYQVAFASPVMLFHSGLPAYTAQEAQVGTLGVAATPNPYVTTGAEYDTQGPVAEEEEPRQQLSCGGASTGATAGG